MEQELVNIIIPVYNVEKYLKKCLRSLQKQTYKNIEIILIDDGSTDGSPQICDKYAADDIRFRVLHKPNGGASSARNAGIDLALESNSDYILFVDADDWLPQKAIELLMKKIYETDADFICGNMVTIFPHRTIKWRSYSNSFFTKEEREIFWEFMADKIVQSPCGKIYRKHLIATNHLRFNESMKAVEDALFNYQYIQCCQTFATIVDDVYYCNRLNSNSTTRRFIPERNICRKIVLEERQKCLGADLTEKWRCNESEFILSRFNKLISDYVKNLPQSEAIDKIQETHLLFSKLLEGMLLKEDIPKDFIGTKSYLKYEPMLESQNYTAIYDCCYSDSVSESNIKIAIKKIMRPIRLLLFYRQ